MVSDIPKTRLDSLTMFVRRFEKEFWTKSTTFMWAINDFFKMNSTVYKSEVQKLGWHLILTKEGYSISVTLDTNGREIPSPICCWIQYNDVDISDFYYSREICKGLYSVTIPSAAVKFLKSKPQKDRKVLKLNFETGIKRGQFVHPDVKLRMLNEFSRDDILLVSNLTDFTMRSREGPDIGCHKALLAARSNFFLNYFKQQPNNHVKGITVSTETKSLCSVIYYLYRGELYPENAEEMVNITKLAWELDIPVLKSRCAKCFSFFVNANNAHWIREEGIESNLKLLVGNADYFLAGMNKTTAPRAESSKNRCRNAQLKGRVKKLWNSGTN